MTQQETRSEESAGFEADERLLREGRGLSGSWDELRRRARTGQFGSLPVVLGVIVIWVIFTLLNPRFISPFNITNLVQQIAATGMIATGVTMVLLLGEIDLSIAAVSGFCASIMAVLNVNHGVSGIVAVAAALALGAAIGAFNGMWVTRFRVPSFVVTLAGLLAFQGALLYTLGGTGTINLNDPFITMLGRDFLPKPLGWILGAVAVMAYVVGLLYLRRRRIQEGLEPRPLRNLVVKAVVVGGAATLLIWELFRDRGVPYSLVIFLGFVVFFDLLTKRTVFGRHVFGVGGDAESARRMGIHVNRVKVISFTLTSFMAAAGGVLAASRLLAVNQQSGSGDLLLDSIAAAVIGGTSLFGGRGSAWSALLGALVIGSIANGMDLLALASSIKFMVTGAVLLLAVTVDALGRRRQEASGTA